MLGIMNNTKSPKPSGGRWQKQLIILPVVTLMVLASVFLYRTIYDTIVSINTESMQEMTVHDLKAVNNALEERWNDMDTTVAEIRATRAISTEDLLANLARGADFVDCKLLALTATDGLVYRSTGVIGLATDRALYDEVVSHDGRFAVRFDYSAGVRVENNREYILLGTAIEPLTVGGVTFDHIFALISIDAIERDLVITSFDRQGIGFIIDENGYYIVNSNRSHNFTFRNNYFEDIAGARVSGYNSPADFIAAIKSGAPTLATTVTDDKNEYVVTLQRMEYSPWYYISYVPEAVFEAQTNKILGILGIVILITFLAVLFAIIYFLWAKEKEITATNAHRAELQGALDLAQQASRAKTTFLNNMSHDIRTPMNAIIGFAQLAVTHISEQESVRAYLGKITKSSEHLLSLINDVLDMSRIESGKITISEKAESLTEILGALRDMFQGESQKKQIKFTVDTAGITDDWVVCDRLRLNQVLLNITSNAVKYTPEGGSVTVTATQRPATRVGCAGYEFCIRDNGIGMSEEFVGTIFEPFTRENSATVSGIQGTGLGMAITHSIVMMIGGTITVKSKLGAGTEVIVMVDMPLAAPPAAVPATVAVEVGAQLGGRRVLLAEDNELNRELAVELLAEEGITVEPAADGQECIAMLTAAAPGYYDLILMDIQMPVMDGLTAARAIRALADPARATIPIIALSANTFAEDKRASREAGMNAHVGKPIKLPELLAEITRLLGEESK